MSKRPLGDDDGEDRDVDSDADMDEDMMLLDSAAKRMRIASPEREPEAEPILQHVEDVQYDPANVDVPYDGAPIEDVPYEPADGDEWWWAEDVPYEPADGDEWWWGDSLYYYSAYRSCWWTFAGRFWWSEIEGWGIW